ncbi:MAG: hypothetical protein JXA49_04535 [Actinobacteria bacterium]|nr:hypothetical protein [Actinomycetota bacterium]
MSGKTRKMRPKGSWKIDDRKMAVLAMVMVTSVALVLGIVFFARGGDSKGKDAGTLAQAEGEKPAAAPAEESTPTIESLTVPPLSLYHERNIFRPLIDMVGSGGGGSTESSGGAADQAVESKAGGTVLAANPNINPSGGSDGMPSAEITIEGVVEEDGTRFLQVRVVDQFYDKVAEGEIFGDYYKLLDINPNEISTILFGDEKFSIGVGQSIYW